MALKPLINEKDLLIAVSAGSEKAFAELFYGYQAQLAGFVHSITRSVEFTEEVIHDVFLKIWQNRDKLDGIDNFTSYLFIITRNYTLNALRKQAAERKKNIVCEAYPDKAYHIAEQEQDTDLELLLENAVAVLPPRQQQVFLLKSQGLKNAEVAMRMDISADSVKKYQQWSVQAICKFIQAKALFLALSQFFNFL